MSGIRFTHIGGPTALIEVEGWRILVDPTFDAPGRTYRFGWGASSRKTVGPAVEIDEIGVIDVVLLTHDHHADNLDESGRQLLPQVPLVLTTTAGAARLASNARGLRSWETVALRATGRATIKVTATPCRHGPAGSRWLVGEVTGFALEWEGQEHGALWITGDTVLFPGVREAATRLEVGTAIVHLGSVRFPITGPLKYTMDASDAIELCELVKPHRVIPVHYDGWSHFKEGRRAIERHLVADRRDAARAFEWAPIGTTITLTI